MSGGVHGPGVTRVVLRPIGSPLPLGFLGLFVATLSFSAVQLGWVSDAQGGKVALAALGLTVPVQLIASVFGFLARDPVAGTGMGILAGTWAAAGLATLTSPPGATGPGLGVVLVTCGLAMLVPAAGGQEKTVAATVMALSALRFMVTGVAELNGAAAWMTAAGWTGVVLAAVSLYAATGFRARGHRQARRTAAVAPGDGRLRRPDSEEDQLADVGHEPGVRQQL